MEKLITEFKTFATEKGYDPSQVKFLCDKLSEIAVTHKPMDKQTAEVAVVKEDASPEHESSNSRLTLPRKIAEALTESLKE